MDILGIRRTSTSGYGRILGREPQRIDILTSATGLVFDAACEHRLLVDVGGLHLPFISVDDLRTNKLATGRLRDQADAAGLPPPDKGRS